MLVLGVATSFRLPPAFNTHQPPPPNPKTSTTARCRGCHFFLVATSLRYPPATTTQPRNEQQVLVFGVAASGCHHLRCAPATTTTLNPENEHSLLVFGVVTFLIKILVFVYKKCNIIYCTCIGTLTRRYPQYPWVDGYIPFRVRVQVIAPVPVGLPVPLPSLA